MPRHPLEDHQNHSKPDSHLHYIIKDAGEARRNMEGMGNRAASDKYADQINDAATVLAYRGQIGAKVNDHGEFSGPKWYIKKYGPQEKEEKSWFKSSYIHNDMGKSDGTQGIASMTRQAVKPVKPITPTNPVNRQPRRTPLPQRSAPDHQPLTDPTEPVNSIDFRV
jgi:hypothetical protein